MTFQTALNRLIIDRLASLKHEVKQIQSDLETRRMTIAGLQEICQDIDQLLDAVNRVDGDEIDNLFDKIVDAVESVNRLRLSLPFYSHFQSQLNEVDQELPQWELLYTIGDFLELDVNEFSEKIRSLRECSEFLRSGSFENVRELLNKTEQFRDGTLGLKDESQKLQLQMTDGWCNNIDTKTAVTWFVPKTCTVKSVKPMLVLLRWDRMEKSEITVKCDGALVEIKGDKEQSSARSSGDRSISYLRYYIEGKHHGRGRVLLSSRDISELQPTVSIPVRVDGESKDFIQESVVWGVPVFGAFVLLVLGTAWWMDESIKDWIGVAGGLGTSVTFAVLIARLVWQTTKRILTAHSSLQ